MQDLNGDPWVMMQAAITLPRVYESMLTIFIPIHTHTQSLSLEQKEKIRMLFNLQECLFILVTVLEKKL